MQILMSVYDEAVAAANVIIEFLDQRPGVLVQVDGVGWYDGPNLILRIQPDAGRRRLFGSCFTTRLSHKAIWEMLRRRCGSALEGRRA